MYEELDVGVRIRVLVDVDNIEVTETVVADTIASLAVGSDFVMVEECVNVVVDRFEGGTCTVENAGSLIFSNLTKEKDWPSWGCVTFLLIDSRLAPLKSR
jgi:hypothetical protein